MYWLCFLVGHEGAFCAAQRSSQLLLGNAQESGGDNLAANFSRELADYTIYAPKRNRSSFYLKNIVLQHVTCQGALMESLDNES